jgi:shikimate dehydrogenase
MVTVDTKLIGLLGNPLKQTFSPQMHNKTFQKLNLNYFYFPIEVGNDKLKEVITGIRNMNFVGFNVTKPNKITILDYLDELDVLAEKIGAVNTVVIKDGKLKGYNTDGEGFVRSLLEKTNIDLSKNTFFIFGAGGASRAISFTLAFEGAKKLFIINRSNEASLSLVNDINSKIGECAEFIDFEEKTITHYLEKSNILVNASGVGMYPYVEKTPVNKEYLNKNLFVCDITYNPPKTKLLFEAKENGCKTMNGIEMVVYQGAKAFSLWTGLAEPVEMMRDIIYKIIGEDRFL